MLTDKLHVFRNCMYWMLRQEPIVPVNRAARRRLLKKEK